MLNRVELLSFFLSFFLHPQPTFNTLHTKMSFSTPPIQSSTAPTPIPTNPPTSATQPHTQQPPAPQLNPPTLPPAHLFDLLPQLHELLSRLLDTDTDTDYTLPQSSAHYKAQEPLAMHQLSGAVSAIRVNIGKARAAIEALPDVSRTIEEQEEELSILKARLARQKEVLGGIRNV